MIVLRLCSRAAKACPVGGSWRSLRPGTNGAAGLVAAFAGQSSPLLPTLNDKFLLQAARRTRS